MLLAQTLIALLLLIALIALGAERLRLPYPVLLVIGGALTSFAPFVPRVPLDPNLILLFFLPPLLYADCFQTSWVEFRASLRPILLLSIGLVIATVVAVAAVARAFFPELSWPLACVLGAVVSPTDTVAAQAVIERLRVPRRISAIVGGESLVNDATGLVAYQFALAAVLTGGFDAWRASGALVLVIAGGLFVGLAVGWAAAQANQRVRDTSVLFTLSLIAPFTAYVLALRLNLSGVLAVVAAGFYVAWRIHAVPANSRFHLYASWNLLVFLLNGLCFALIGLELPGVLEALEVHGARHLALAAIGVCAAVIAVRMAWVYPGAYLPFWLSRRIREREPIPRPRNVFIVGWCGMRGVVSLAAALAIPKQLADGTPFPGRDLIVFLTFCVVLATLLGQGLSLPLLIRALGIPGDELSEREERVARGRLIDAALARLAQLREEHRCSAESITLVEATYRDRLAALAGQEALREQIEAADRDALSRNAQLQALAAERLKMLELRDQQVINDRTMQKLQAELDLAEMRLTGA